MIIVYNDNHDSFLLPRRHVRNDLAPLTGKKENANVRKSYNIAISVMNSNMFSGFVRKICFVVHIQSFINSNTSSAQSHKSINA